MSAHRTGERLLATIQISRTPSIPEESADNPPDDRNGPGNGSSLALSINT
jgi:hypothetical protein